jgi:hypothetical protein
MHKFGSVQEITYEKWSSAYSCKVGKGIRLVKVDLNKHISSQPYIDGYRAFIPYVKQPVGYFVCKAVDQMARECLRISKN